MRIALQQIYVNLFVEYGEFISMPSPKQVHTHVCLAVVKNPLSPTEHPNGLGVYNELFEESLEQFVVWPIFRTIGIFGQSDSCKTRVLS
jgi:hypothetical protein